LWRPSDTRARASRMAYSTRAGPSSSAAACAQRAATRTNGVASAPSARSPSTRSRGGIVESDVAGRGRDSARLTGGGPGGRGWARRWPGGAKERQIPEFTQAPAQLQGEGTVPRKGLGEPEEQVTGGSVVLGSFGRPSYQNVQLRPGAEAEREFMGNHGCARIV